MKTVYLDNNATTRVLPEILQAMLPWLSECYGNPSSSHVLGQQAKEALMDARSMVAKFMAASSAEVVFTSGATESIHNAILGVLSAGQNKRRIVTTTVEHTATLGLLDSLSEQGIEVVQVPVNQTGLLDMEALQEAITPDTALVTVMHANNETGVIFPISKIAEMAHAQGALLHVDAAQTAGKLLLDVKELGCDLLSFSGHKLHAPKGVGVLFVRKGVCIEPLLQGHQERRRRGGTENLPGIIGLATACNLVMQSFEQKTSLLSGLRDRLEQGILQRLSFVFVNGTALRISNTSNLCFSGLDAEALLYKLDRAGVLASRGSACTAGGTAPSHVLLAMGLNRDEALASLRFSLSTETTILDIDLTIQAVADAVAELMQDMSVAA